MKIQLLHPEVASLTCDECKAWIYDIKTGKKMERRGQPQRREPGQATPCHECPKESPEKAKECELSEKNWKTLQLYRADKAIHCLTDKQRQDEILQQNFLVIDQMNGMFERRQAAELLAVQLLPLLR